MAQPSLFSKKMIVFLHFTKLDRRLLASAAI